MWAGFRGMRFATPEVEIQVQFRGSSQVNVRTRGRAVARLAAQLAVVAAVVALVLANVWVRSTWSEMEDGVLWYVVGQDVTASRVAPGSAADRAGIQTGDILLAIDSAEVRTVQQVTDRLHAARRGQSLAYTIVRTNTNQMLPLEVLPIPAGSRGLYFALAAVGHLLAVRRCRRAAAPSG